MLLCILLCVAVVGTNAARPDGTIACDPALRPVEITAAGTVISSPGFDGTNPYPPDQLCEWRIVGEPGLNALVTFSTFFTEECIDCNCDRLEVYSGQDDTGALIGKYCGNQGASFSVAGGQDAFLRFVSDASSSGTGFQGTVGFGDASCSGGQIYTDLNGTFTSPNYPSTYPNGASCRWTIVAPSPDYRIDVSFDVFDVEEGCAGFGSIYDYVDMYGGDGNRLARWFGAGPSDPNFLFSNYAEDDRVVIEFTSDFSIGASGFSGRWQTVLI